MALMMMRQITADLDGDLPAPATAKTMAVIEAVGRKADGLTQTQVVKATDCFVNLVFRVLSTLKLLGYMPRREESRSYALIGRLLKRCQLRKIDKCLMLFAHSVMEWLRDRSRETVQQMIRTGNRGMVLNQVSGLEPVQVVGQIGMRVPLYSWAPGKATLAALPDAELDEWLAATPLKSFTENTNVIRTELLSDLERSRRRGYAEDWEEGIKGIRCVAAPILDARDRPVGAITAMSPVMRLPRKRFAELGQWCVEAAACVRKELFT